MTKLGCDIFFLKKLTKFVRDILPGGLMTLHPTPNTMVSKNMSRNLFFLAVLARGLMTRHPTPHTRIWVIPVGAWCLDICPSGWVPVDRVGMVIVAPTSALLVTRYMCMYSCIYVRHLYRYTYTHRHTYRVNMYVCIYIYIDR